MKKISIIISSLFYVGFFPRFPGTIGSLFTFIIYLFLPRNMIEHPFFFVVPFMLILPAVYLTSKAEVYMKKDDSRIVLDEFVGYFFAVLFLPKSFVLGLIALILFRFFDIFKPPPVYQVQYLKGGWGIVIDDVIAGIYANLCLQIIYFLIIVR